MTNRLLLVATSTSLAVLVSACGGMGGAVRDMRFPSRDDLEAALAAPVAPPELGDRTTVASWEFDQLRPRAGFEPVPVPPTFPGASRLSQHNAPHTAGLSCAARQVARFYAEYDEFPAGELAEVMASWCGASGGLRRMYVFSGDVGAPESVYSSSIDAAAGWIGNYGAWGVAQVDVDGTSYFGITVSDLDLQVDVLDVDIRGESVSISGMVLQEFEELDAVATRGTTGADKCVRDAEVAWPSFRFECPVDPSDTDMEISLNGRETGRLLFTSGTRVRLSPEGGPPSDAWSLYVLGEPSEDGFGTSFLDQINAWRANAGAPPVRLEAAQGEAVRRAIPALFSRDASDRTVDLVSMGLMAGWDVATPRLGAGISSAVVGTQNPAVAASELVADPFTRYMLMDPENDAIALGSMALGDAAGFCVVTYEDFVSVDVDAAADTLFERLAAERRGRGHETTRALPRGQERALEVAAERIAEDQRRPDRALSAAMGRIVPMGNNAVYGYNWTFMYSLDGVPFPDAMLDAEHLDVAFAVAPYRPNGSAWTSYAIIAAYRLPNR